MFTRIRARILIKSFTRDRSVPGPEFNEEIKMFSLGEYFIILRFRRVRFTRARNNFRDVFQPRVMYDF